MARRRPKFEQYIREAPEPVFAWVVPEPGANYWLARIRDVIYGDEPEFIYRPPKKGCPYTVQELANRVAGELNEGTGFFTLREFRDGVPVFACAFASNGRQVFCVRSTDSDRAEPVDLTAGERWLATRRSGSPAPRAAS